MAPTDDDEIEESDPGDDEFYDTELDPELNILTEDEILLEGLTALGWEGQGLKRPSRELKNQRF
jgi:hypothetical protein